MQCLSEEWDENYLAEEELREKRDGQWEEDGAWKRTDEK